MGPIYLRLLAVSVAMLAILPALPAQGSSTEHVGGASALFERETSELPATAPYAAFVHFRPGTFSTARELLGTRGLTITSSFDPVGVVFATGTVGGFLSLRAEESVAYLEANKPLHYYGNTSAWATRLRVAQEPVAGGPFLDPKGGILDGSGIGVAVVDSGIDATHPDLRGRMEANYKVICVPPRVVSLQPETCPTPVVVQEAPNTDSSSGHGTHVAGIVAGDGTQSNGTYRGTAPGAKLYGFGTGEHLVILTASEALNYILERYETFVPRIRVINNSYGDDPGDVYDPNSVYSKLVRALVSKGVVFTFAAGNGAGDGTADKTSSFCKDPTPGVICVANYSDGLGPYETIGGSRCAVSRTDESLACTWSEPMFGLANRSGMLDASSSRGKRGTPDTYPDISAPGTLIHSTCLDAVQPVCASRLAGRISTAGNRWQPWYAALTGTSMAAPHIAGAAALLTQARPQASPAEIEDLMKDTAHKFVAYDLVNRGTYSELVVAPYVTDPTNEGQTTSYDRGAGLLDVLEALRNWDVPGEGLPADGGQRRRIITDATDDGIGPGAADVISVDVVEEDDGFKHQGFRYFVKLRDADDVPRSPDGTGVMLQLSQMVDGYGMIFATSIWIQRDHVQPVRRTGFTRYDNSAPAISVSRDIDTNTVSFFVPYAHLADPAPGIPIHNVHMSATVGPLMSPSIMDYAPGGVGPDAFLRPGFGTPYSALRAPVDAPDPEWAGPGYRRPGEVDRIRNASASWQSPPMFSSVTPDGRYVAYTSESPGGVFVQDRVTGDVRRVSISSGGVPAGGIRPVISADGRFVAFISGAGYLVPGDNNGALDVFVHDRDSDADGVFDESGSFTTERVSVSSSGTQVRSGDLLFGRPSITPDGRFVVFSSDSPSLVAGDTNAQADVFVHDRSTRSTELVSLTNTGKPGEDSSISFGIPTSISDDGRYVSFYSEAQDLVPGDTNGQNRNDQGFDVFVRDRQESKTVRVSVADDGSEIPATVPTGALYSSMSSDGRFLAFISEAWTLVPEDSNGGLDIFVHDRDADEDGEYDEPGGIATTRASVASDGSQAEEQDVTPLFKRGNSSVPAISGDGRFIAFESIANNLAPGDGNDELDVFLHDRFAGTTERVSVSPEGMETDQGSYNPVLSETGRHLMFGGYSPPTTVSRYFGPFGGWDRQLYYRDRGPTYGVGHLDATLTGGRIDVAGWATFSGSRVATGDDDVADAPSPDVDLTSADVIYRPESDDLLARLRVDEAPSHDYRIVGVRSSAMPGAIYGFELVSDGVRYEARVTVPHGQFAEDSTGVQSSYELFRCDPTCDKNADLTGSLGTTGDEAWIVIPRRFVGLDEGDEVTGLRAFTALGASTASVSILDEMSFPDSTIPRRTVSIGVAPIGAGEDAVEFIDITDRFSEGKFSTSLDATSLAPGGYEVWAKGCIDDQCGSTSRSVTVGTTEPTESASPTPSVTPSSSPTEVDPGPDVSTLAFTGTSSASGQHSDQATWQAQLLTSEGAGIGGATVDFTLVGAELTQTFTSVTNDQGIASVTEVLAGKPGAYQLTVRYEGDEDHTAAADVASFVIEKEDSKTSLTIEVDKGSRELVARLTDADAPGSAIAGRSIEFFAADRPLGTIMTDAQGIARFTLQGKYKSGKHTYEAAFAGDEYYRPSFDRRTGQ